MFELDDDSVNYVKPITDLMAEGRYEEARTKVYEVPVEWRIAVIWTVAAQTGIVL